MNISQISTLYFTKFVPRCKIYIDIHVSLHTYTGIVNLCHNTVESLKFMKANFYGMPIFTGSRGPNFVGLKIIKSIFSIIIHGGCTFEDMGNSKILSCNFCFQFNLKVGIQENILVLAFNDSTVFKNLFTSILHLDIAFFIKLKGRTL